MDFLKKLLGILNPAQNATTGEKAGTLATIAAVIGTALVVLTQLQSVLCKLGAAAACIAAPQ